MDYVYYHYLLKHPLLWIFFPLWILMGIIFGLAKETESPRRR